MLIMPFSCCRSKKDSVVVSEVGNDANNEDNNEARRERELAESIFYDARQSLTASMMYRPATSTISRLVSASCSLDTKPRELLLVGGGAAAAAVPRDSVIVKQDLQSSPGAVQAGYPGHLTEVELETCLAFRKLVKEKRNTEDDSLYYEMIHIFDGFENEAFAICRFMRARKFVIADSMELMNASREVWNDGKAHDFYPNSKIQAVMGCPMSLLRRELPLNSYGVAKNGSMVNYFQVGNVSLEALDCLTDLENFVPYFWNLLTHAYLEEANKLQKEHPDITILSEITMVIDLKGIQRSLFTDRVMKVLKSVVTVLNCFPENLSKLVIINAPFFFSAIWLILRNFLDPRSVAKIDIYSSESSGVACIKQHIDETELISNYGGKGPSYEQVLHELREPGTKRQMLERIFQHHGNASPSYEFDLAAEEKATVTVFTRAAIGTVFTVSKDGEKEQEVQVKPDDGALNDDGNTIQPYSKEVASKLRGPGHFIVSTKPSSDGHHHKEHFLVEVRVYG